MSKQPHKITPEVRKQIKELVSFLPPTPYLIKDKDGLLIIQQTKVSKEVSHAELKEKKIDIVQGEAVDTTKRYVNHFLKNRMMNHEVELTQKFRSDGQFGIDSYVNYIQGLNESIQAAAKHQEELSKKRIMPNPVDYGFSEEKSEWMVEGGENAYDAALAAYYDSQTSEEKFKVFPTEDNPELPVIHLEPNGQTEEK